ncbi:MAG: bifunctional histidinol-phosphatase/imidazoleglycerol-phosphate dehydratase HisB [Xanthomonadaceae bacterium]|jgi:imidazoleglycerol-phosphate dehydratase/histidinol-phosphatase|nr:bifunctional histidinol-phosphatase/imidazoleglycerol-phosphate dehydratase HisB [Xanthomonadaceae bacterium]
MPQKILFIDRDGVLIEEPADQQIDAFEKFRLVPGCIAALQKLRDAGFQFVMVSNQDGLGTPSFPRAAFEGPQRLLLQVLESQGIVFRELLIDESFAHENKPTRKPGLGMVMHYLRDRDIDLANSAMVGDRETDMQFASNLGVRGFRLKDGHHDWAGIAQALTASPRTAAVERTTKETKISVQVDLDRASDPAVATGHGFFDHMLEQLGKHGGFGLAVRCAGDLHIDEHHTVEDCALAIGQALKQALGDKRGIGRYGFTLPMDETLASAAIDFSGRPYFVFEGAFPRTEVGGLATELVPHFFRSLCESAGLNLHLQVRGENTHHMVEACFKVVARALRQAIRREGTELPSTKGVL